MNDEIWLWQQSFMVNSEKIKIKILIFYIKKLKKNSYKYKLYILWIMNFKKIFKFFYFILKNINFSYK